MNLATLLDRIDTFRDMRPSPQRDAYAARHVPTTTCAEFIATLRAPDAIRTASIATTSPDRVRFTMLADAYATNASFSPPRTPRKLHPSTIARNKRTAACLALQNAARTFGLTHKLPALATVVREFALLHRYPFPKTRTRKIVPIEIARADVGGTAYALALFPTRENLRLHIVAVALYTAAIARAHDVSTPARMLSDAWAPEEFPPNIKRAPVGAIDWASAPVIGMNPSSLHDMSEDAAIRAALPHTIRAHRAATRPGRVNTRNIDTPAPTTYRVTTRVGRPTLTLAKGA